MPGFIIGLVLAISSALLLAAGSELQSQAVYKATGRWARFLKDPHWYLGISVLSLAVGFNFLALSQAPVSAVQAMGIVALVASVTFGVHTGGVEIKRTSIIYIFACVTGILGFISILATHAEHQYQPPFVELLIPVCIIVAVLAGFGVLIMILAKLFPGTASSLGSLVIGAMLFGSIASVFKVLVELVTNQGLLTTLLIPGNYAVAMVLVVGGGVGNILLMQSHFAFPAPLVVSGLTIIDTLAATIIGILVLKEVALTPASTFALVFFGALAISGVFALTTLKRATSPDTAMSISNPLRLKSGISTHTSTI